MIEAEKLTKRYRPVTVVGGLTFTARRGHVTGFLGPNGAGGAVAIGVCAALLAGMDLLPYRPRTGRLLAADGHAGSRFSARQRQHRRSRP